MPHTKILRVVCALIIHNNKVLVARRAAGQNHAGQWEFPGGKIKDLEKPEAAIVREIREELALVVQPIKRLSPVTHDYETFCIELTGFICSIKSGTLNLIDHDEIQWMNPAKEAQAPLLPPDRMIWEEFRVYYNNHSASKSS